MPQPLTPALFRQRLMIVTIALVMAQVMYLLLAVAMIQHNYKVAANSSQRTQTTTAIFLAGVLAAVISFPVTQVMAGRQATMPDFATTSAALQKRFFVGFVFSEVASLAGLLIFFIYADVKPLLLLVSIASASIIIHYLRTKKAIEDIERK